MALSDENSKIDNEKLDLRKIKTTVSGCYMEAWNVLFQSQKLPQNLDDYLITFEETDEEILIYLTKPLKVKMLGGGSGVFKVSKVTWTLVEGGGLAK